jgi:hypothetical protein
LVLAALVPAAGMIAWLLADTARQARDEAHDTLHHLAAQTAGRVERYLQEVEPVLERLAQRPLVRALDPQRCDPILAEYVSLNPRLVSIGVRDREGRLLCSPTPHPPAPVGAPAPAWIPAAMAQSGFRASDAYFAAAVSRWVTVLSHPVQGVDGERAGVIGLPVDLEALGREAMPVRPPGVRIALLDRQGRLMAVSPPEPNAIGKPVALSTPATGSPRSESGARAAEDRATPMMTAWLTLPDLEWRIVVERAESEVFAAAREAAGECADRNAKRVGGFAVGEALYANERDGLALFVRQFAHRRPNIVSFELGVRVGLAAIADLLAGFGGREDFAAAGA